MYAIYFENFLKCTHKYDNRIVLKIIRRNYNFAASEIFFRKSYKFASILRHLQAMKHSWSRPSKS